MHFFCLAPIICPGEKDTTYYNEVFSICEQPVAEYYRVCNLNKIENILDGEFIFYNKNGLQIKKGNYSYNEMTGNWFYYDSLNNLRTIFKCNSSSNVTSILIINANNDTLLKNGNGKFSFSGRK